MLEERMNSMENLMQQLIKMVAETNEIAKETRQRVMGLEERMDGLEFRMDSLESRMDRLESRMDNMEKAFQAECILNSKRHEELLKEIRLIHIDIDYLRDKQSKHDMEINKLKALVQSDA